MSTNIELQELLTELNDKWAMNVQQTGRSVVLKELELTSDDPIDDGNSDFYNFRPPENKLWSIKYLFFNVNSPGGNSDDSHDLILYVGANQSYNVISGVASGNERLRFRSSFENADKRQFPSTEIGQIEAISNLIFDNDNRIWFRYRNNSGVTQNNERKFYLIVEEESI